MKLIVAGSRTLPEQLIDRCEELILMHSPLEIVSGLAVGPDQWGKQIANEFRIACKEFPAQWDLFGKRAGFVRNEQMADYADALIAMWDGKSNGTKHMIGCMLVRQKPIHVEWCR